MPHTPGPWYAEHDGIYADEGDSRFLIAVARDSSQILANALLIAAAPSLLEACQDALKTNDKEMQHFLDNGRLRKVLQDAIAEATGESAEWATR